MIDDPDSNLPDLARDLARLHLDRIAQLSALIDDLTRKINEVSSESAAARMLRTMPGVGPICAMAIEAFAPAMDSSKAAGISRLAGPHPASAFNRGKATLGRTSKMGQRDIRRLLIVGAMSVIASAQRYKREAGAWLQDKLNRKPRIVAAIALCQQDGPPDLGDADQGRNL